MVVTEKERENILVDMMNLLDEYDYDYTAEALEEILNEWEYRKSTLIDAFKKHPHYLEGKFMIAFDCDYERVKDKGKIENFSAWLAANTSNARKYMPEDMIKLADSQLCIIPYSIYGFLTDLYKYSDQFVTAETAEYLNKIIPEAKVHVGQKMSRVVNKICNIVGYDKLENYNREFAKYADALNPLTIKRHTILSVNPLDYLTMSFGNSWASCHTIDKNNKRGMPNAYSGCYSSGTISYMLDPSSMVFYTVDAAYNENNYWTQPKINRQMFHYGEEKLIQSRLYPQDNDGFSDAYTPYRNIVQEIISTIFGFPNLWTISKGTENASRYIDSVGTHYADYVHYSNCNMSRIKGSTNENYLMVGHRPICIECGDYHSECETINCCNRAGYECSDCGCLISGDDVFYVNGEPYCRDCVEYCECCDEWHRMESTWIESEDRYVCDDCLSRYYHYCEECGEYYYEDDCRWIEYEEKYVCEHCYDKYYRCCTSCEEDFRPEDMILHNGHYYCECCYDELENKEEEENEAV